MGKVLVCYFSRADENYNVGKVDVGNTEIFAKYITNKEIPLPHKILFLR